MVSNKQIKEKIVVSIVGGNLVIYSILHDKNEINIIKHFHIYVNKKLDKIDNKCNVKIYSNRIILICYMYYVIIHYLQM